MARYYYKKGTAKVFGTDLRSLAMKAQKYADELGRAVMIYTDDAMRGQAIRKVYKSNPGGRKYYTLAVREHGRWGPQFGSYDKEDVTSEREDYRDHDYKASDLKILTTGAKKADVDAAIRKLNNA